MLVIISLSLSLSHTHIHTEGNQPPIAHPLSSTPTSYEPRHFENDIHWQPGDLIQVRPSSSNLFDSSLEGDGQHGYSSDARKLWEDVQSLVRTKFGGKMARHEPENAANGGEAE